MSAATACQWCATAMERSTRPKKFCASKCRGDFHEACRLFGERMFAEGAVSIAQLHAERRVAT